MPRALTALKYFCENAPEYAVIATGSSMGITIHQGTSFPVGKVDMQRLYPMTFYEFLMACGRESLAELFMADVGLLGCMMGLDWGLALDGDALFGQARGAMAEQLVCQQLVAMGWEPYYWQADNSSAELDFVVQHGGKTVLAIARRPGRQKSQATRS